LYTDGPVNSVPGVRGVCGVLTRRALPMMTLCLGVAGIFFASRRLGVLGTAFSS
jgi:hypothetical protein